MRCVDWTPEYLHGLIIIALLRTNDLDAHLFGENFVRQDWFLILAYDGFRVMVPKHQTSKAHGIIDSYRNGAFALPDKYDDACYCPECDNDTRVADLSPRRWAFLVYFAFTFGFYPTMLHLWIQSDLLIAPSVVLTMALAVCLPACVRQLVVGRYRCTTCAATWRELPDKRFFHQQQEAETAMKLMNP